MKRVTITCDRCGAYSSGTNHSGLWARLKASGWVKGEAKNLHYCPECWEKKKAPAATGAMKRGLTSSFKINLR